MNKKNLGDILIQIFSLIFVFIILDIIKGNELVSSVVIILALLINFKIKYYKNEWILFFLGLFVGILIEVGTAYIYKMQYLLQLFFFCCFWNFLHDNE